MRNLHKSKKLLSRAESVIPRAAQTLSKAPDQFVRGVSPYALLSAQGCTVFDVDGNEYIDLVSSLGAIILGYGEPAVEEAVREQRDRGTIFSLPGPLEVELAEKLKELIPFLEQVRFGLNGSDATSGAIRTARAYTGREHVAKCGYHGWSDWTIATNPLRSKGVPRAVKSLTHEFSYNKIETLEKLCSEYAGQLAAIVIEPVSSVPPEQGFLEKVREIATREGALLIFDELVTGFRLGMGGAAEYFGVTPDLACYGKAISNGEPLSVFGGKKEYMSVLEESEVFVSFTYAGYLPSIAAALATLRFMKAHPVHARIAQSGRRLIDGYNNLAKKYEVPTQATGIDPHPLFLFKNSEGGDDLLLKSLFIQETAKEGILTSCSNMMNYAHTDEVIEEVVKRLERVFLTLGTALKKGNLHDALQGPMVRPRNKPAVS